MLRDILVLLSCSIITWTLASYCGQAAIPFTFQVLHSGLPVLGCARPKCFGWNANGTRAGETAQFYRVDGKEDGYLRRSDQLVRSPFRNLKMTPRVAKCEEKYSNRGCSPGQWLGGIAPKGLIQESAGLHVRCCSYAPLLDSEDRGVAMVTHGQLVVGGEVLDGGELDGFDYIADIKIEEVKQGKTIYAVYVRRMECKDEDSENSGEPQISQNVVVQNLDGDVRPTNSRATEINSVAPPTPEKSVAQTTPPQKPYPYGIRLQQGYGVAGGPTPRYIQNQQPVVPVAAPGYNQQAISQPAVQRQPLVQLQQQYATVQSPQAPGAQPIVAPTYAQYNAAPAQIGQQPFGLFNPFLNPLMQQSSQQVVVYPQQQQQGMAVQQQSLPLQLQQVPMVLPVPTTPAPTIPPLTFPTLDQIPKIDIPSVEDVENVIPPVQKAILTTVAKFFGVL